MYFYILGGGKNNLEWGGGGVNEFSIYFKDTACFSRCAYFLRSRNGHGHARVNCSLMNRGRVIREF